MKKLQTKILKEIKSLKNNTENYKKESSIVMKFDNKNRKKKSKRKNKFKK